MLYLKFSKYPQINDISRKLHGTGKDVAVAAGVVAGVAAAMVGSDGNGVSAVAVGALMR